MTAFILSYENRKFKMQIFNCFMNQSGRSHDPLFVDPCPMQYHLFSELQH